MSIYLIRIIGLADGRPSPVDGQWLVDCDVDARDGRGHVRATADQADARRFGTHEETHEYWRRQSAVMPVRSDGHPNRPLTAFTVESIRFDTSDDALQD